MAGVLTAVLSAALLSAVAAPAAANSSTTVGDYVYSYDSGNVAAGATITDHVGARTVLTIPGTVTIGANSYPVTHIGAGAFYENSLTSVTIPTSVTTIGTAAFQSNSLTAVTIPNAVTTLGDGAFMWNDLTSVILPASLKTIGNSAFHGNKLTSVTIPTRVTTIGPSAFSSNLLTSVAIPSSVSTIGTYSFQDNRLTSLNIPSSLTTISAHAFEMNKLTSVTIPSSITTIGDNAFSSNSLTSVTIPSSVTSLGAWAFYSNDLTSVTIPSSIATISDDAFRSNLLTSVTIPKSVTTIGNAAFNDNEITSVTIPSGVTAIGTHAFSSNLLTSVTIPTSVTTIGASAFAYNLLTSVTIPTSITTISDSTFYRNKLTSLTLPSSVTTIGASAFGNNLLTSVTIPASVTAIGDKAFEYNATTYAQLDSVVMLGSVPTTMGVQPFGVAGAAKPLVTFKPAFATSGYTSPTWTAGGEAYASGVAVGDYVYSYASGNVAAGAAIADYIGSSTVLTIPGAVTIDSHNYSVTTISAYAFSSNLLTSVTIPTTVTTIGYAAFYQNKLTSVAIPYTVTTISAYAFSSNLLRSATIPSTVTTIDEAAFYQNKLTSVVVPSAVTTISDHAFQSNLLTSVTIPTTVTTIGDYAFHGNPLDSVVMKGLVPTTMGVQPFGVAGAAKPLVTFYSTFASSGYTTPTWTAGGQAYSSASAPEPLPAVTTVSLPSGSTAGGMVVTLTGSHFTGATSVTFGGVAGTSVSVISDSRLTVKAPPHAAGAVDVVVTAPSGSSQAKTFTYVAWRFSDVSSSHPFYAQVEWLATQGITSGYDNGGFGVTDAVTRGQMAVFLYKLAGSPAYTPPAVSQFTDVPVTHPFYKQVSWIVDQRISSGYGNGLFGVTDPVTRGQMSVFLYKDAGSPTYTPPVTSKFPDVPVSHPFYKYVSWLAANHISNGYANGTFGPSDAVTRGQMAVFLYNYAHLP